ncbi:MbcA/ParS/Xre antitoxin family protein [Pseudoduganella namucuonensis]|uniref:MbcA/ParS/Xre antitoxin family protein n=1 Tax=Pseudoduganella namucuonensis TaxID=1035707 RepID=UPI0015A50745|nr:MbcA/ParS/Xre antitoxin family protein [Pseudoduganella namucuonensis]
MQQQVVARATRVVGSCGKAFKWLQVENPYFDGLVPIELLDTDDGAARVLAYITQYERDHPIRR